MKRCWAPLLTSELCCYELLPTSCTQLEATGL